MPMLINLILKGVLLAAFLALVAFLAAFLALAASQAALKNPCSIILAAFLDDLPSRVLLCLPLIRTRRGRRCR